MYIFEKNQKLCGMISLDEILGAISQKPSSILSKILNNFLNVSR